MSLSITSTEISEVLEIESDLFHDDRGYFTEFYNDAKAHDLGFDQNFVQDNLSLSAKGVLRGLHYQLNPHAQGKLVRCVTGSIFDVAVDIRDGSPTYGYHVARELSAMYGNALWIPEGFAHGFLSLEDDTHVLYKCTAHWVNGAERAIRFNDTTLEIPWPFEPTQMSQKDTDAPLFAELTESSFPYTRKEYEEQGSLL
jgi:dTDP-4-dehydrorhamnose 3,5-epimerase